MRAHGAPARADLGDPHLASFCPNCGAPREDGAVFCARCGRNFTQEFKGTPIDQVEDASEVFLRLRTAIGDRYVIERELGKGGMATVYLARDVKHDREVAIKVLHPELSASIGADRFEREIRLAAKLQHPHILGLYDSGDADGLLYYVMPFVKGESLRDRLDREGMLPVEDAIRYTLEVCGALHYAHEQGIVHRDIKPENIMLSGDHALVADFGIARAANDASGQKLTQTGMAVGTPVYMAPEQSTGDAVGPQADIYSLGCMLYEMLAGEPPFTGANQMAIMAKHLMEQVPSVRVVRSTVPESVEEAIFHAMAKAPVDRPKSAQAFGEMLGMSLSQTAMMRTMRPSSVMRGSTIARGSTMVPRQTVSGSVFKLDETGELVEVVPTAWWKRPMTIVAAALVLTLGGVGAWMAANRQAAAPADPTARRIAVTYFDDLSRDSTLGPAAAGITEGLIRSLSRISAITTVSQSGSESVRAVADRDSIFRALSVSYLVQGDLEPVGDRVKVNYRLVHKSGDRPGSGSLTVSRDSVALIQDSIAVLAADLIRQKLGAEIQLAEQRVATTNNAAWLALQEGLQLRRRAEQAVAQRDAARATVLFQGADSAYALAHDLDPRWAEPYVRRAQLSERRSLLAEQTPQARRPWIEAGIAYADSALARDAQDASALEARGRLRYRGFINSLYDGPAAMQALQQAVADLEKSTTINPKQGGAWSALGAMYYRVPGKSLSDVMFALQQALASDEFLSNANEIRGRLATTAYDNGDFRKADEYCRDIESRYPGDLRTIRCRLYLQSIPGLQAYDIDRAWRLTDSLVVATGSGDTLYARHVGGIFTAATIARAAMLPGAPPALKDSARAVARRWEGNAILDQPRDLIQFAAYPAVVLQDYPEAFRRLTIYVAVDPETRRSELRNSTTWWFTPLLGLPEWQRLVGTGP